MPLAGAIARRQKARHIPCAVIGVRRAGPHAGAIVIDRSTACAPPHFLTGKAACSACSTPDWRSAPA
ncbi:hypothetical protein PPH41_44055, partial [Burkholderia gladioli]|nr:hypothetical protein [Burkholderia gladioli]